MNVFVTTGGMNPWDDMIRYIDTLKYVGYLNCDIRMQIGDGHYKPKHCEWFRYDVSLDDHYKWADVVVSHGGAGTIIECVKRNKKLIVLENPSSISNPDIIIAYGRDGRLKWCRNMLKVGSFIKDAKKWKLKRNYKPMNSWMDYYIFQEVPL
jgi:UDP-N-acetylglucosamine transferase subunit ALG13